MTPPTAAIILPPSFEALAAPNHDAEHRNASNVTDREPEDEQSDQSWDEIPPPEERSMELPAVIIGERGEEDEQPRTRVLPGRIPKHFVLYPAYAAVGLAALLATRFSLSTGEWHPMMTLAGWGLLYCWYWVYGVGYRYRRWFMKYFALLMSTVTAGSLIMVSAVRATSLAVPAESGLAVRDSEPMLFFVIGLTTLSLAAVFTHAVYLGRGYRQKRLHANNETG